MVIYGIKNCDTVKKARIWLDSRGVSYEFHDFKIAGIDRAHLEKWVRTVGWEVLLNRAGTTFRKLPERDKQVDSPSSAIELMINHPTIIRRPVLEHGSNVLVGFKSEVYERDIARKS